MVPKQAKYFYNRGNSYRAIGRNRRAIEDYDKAIGLDPNQAAAYNNRGSSYDAVGQKQRAIED